MGAAVKAVQGDRHVTGAEVFQIIVDAGLFGTADYSKIKAAFLSGKDHPINLVGKLSIPDIKRPGKFVPIDEVFTLVAEKLGLTYQRIDLLKVPLDVVGGLIPHAYAKRLSIVPVAFDDEKVTILTSEPYVTSWIHEIESHLRKKVELRLYPPAQINHLLNEIFMVQKAFKNISREQADGEEKQKLLRAGKVKELDKLIETSKGKKLNAQDGFTATIVDWLLNFAQMERASDIHIEPKKGLGLVRFRIDGDLHTVYRLDPDSMTMVISRLKILGEMKLDEKRKPQDGGVKRTFDNGKEVEMRLSTIPTPYGEKMVIRLFDKTVAGSDMSFIGFSLDDLKAWESLISQPQGLILVTGPTGSGKTTTLYTSLMKVATPDVNVCTAEDPVEMEVDNFNQVQVNAQIGLTFAECIRSFLRQDPDIIMVGEIRDLETGEMAIQSSLTGHLVFSTLHTNGALATIQRLIDIGLPSYLINSSVSGILAQRLVKKLCSHCKTQKPMDPEKWKTLLDGEELEMPATCFEAVGCEECKHTGYNGRVCVYELIKFDDKIKSVIHSKIDIVELKAKTKGMYNSIRVTGARKVIAGETSIEEVMKVVY